MKQSFAWMICAAVLVPGQLSAQGLINGFLQGKENTTLALSYTSESGNDFFVGSTRVTSRPFGKLETESASLYLAHGLSNQLDLVVSVPWIKASSDGLGAPPSDEGFQDLSVYLKWQPWETDLGAGKLSWVGAIGAQIPLSDYVVESPISIGQDSTNVDAKLLLHYVSGNRFFADLTGGYTEKESGVPNAIYGSLKVGYFSDRWYFDAWIESQDSPTGNDIGAGPFRSTEVDFERIGGTAYFRVSPKAGLAFGASEILDGKNVKDQRTFSTSLVFNF